MRAKSTFRREALQWILAGVLVVSGMVVWRLSNTQQAHAQEAQPDARAQVECQ